MSNSDINFDAELQSVMNALTKDRQRGYDSVTLEEFFREFGNHPTGTKILQALKCDINLFIAELETYLENVPTRSPCNHRNEDFTDDLQQVLRTSASIAVSFGASRKIITMRDILTTALLVTEDISKGSECFMHEIFIRHKITPDAVKNLKDAQIFAEDDMNEKVSDQSEETSSEEQKTMTKIIINMNALAKKGKYDSLIGREKEVEAVIQSLSRKKKNSPLLVGEPGVGKTAVIEGMVKKIVEGTVPSVLKDAQIFCLDIGSLLSGTKYRGDFEKRFKFILTKLSSNPNNILFIDEIHMIIGAGAASGGNTDVANMLKPYISSGDIKIIGATTFDEQRKIFDKDAALSRRFQVVAIDEPNEKETMVILKGAKQHYEKFHNVSYTDEVLELSVKLANRYLANKKQPDKSFDIIDEAGAKVKLAGRKEVTELDIERVVSSMAHLPEKTVEGTEKEKLKALKNMLSSKVFGQDEAITSLVNSILVAKAGLGGKGKNKPLGSFLFTGATGVGKTEICKQLSESLAMPMLRYDMSEYMDKASVSSLIGASPGYIGFEQGGVLTNAVKKQPYSIVLLDEIEKADKAIYNLLLQILDNGFIKDNSGVSIDFRNTIIVMTTNAGAEAAKKNTIGLTSNLDALSSSQRYDEIKKIFTPEFRNRIDKIINFNDITDDVAYLIVERKLSELKKELEEQGLDVIFSHELKDFIKQKGFNKAEGMGARPIDRTINDLLSVPLAEKILFEDINTNEKLLIDIDVNKNITINKQKNKKQKKDEVLEEVLEG